MVLPTCTGRHKRVLQKEKKGRIKNRVIFLNARTNCFPMNNVTQTGDMSTTNRVLSIMLRYVDYR